MLNRHFPLGGAPKHVGDRDYFVAARDGAADAIVVGRLEPGRWSRGLSFRVARRRSSPDGSFDGVIAVRLSAGYFEEFFGKIIGNARGAIAVFRADGAILARNATVPQSAPGQEDELRSDFASLRPGEATVFTSTVDGVERLGAVRALDKFPVLVAYAVDMRAIREQWLGRLVPFAVVALSSSLILLLLSLYVRRIASSERSAQLAWQDEVRGRLRREVPALRRFGRPVTRAT